MSASVGFLSRKSLTTVAVAALALNLSGCTNKPETSTIRVQLPALVVGSPKSKVISQGADDGSDSWSYPSPSTMSDVKCYAVSVETPEMVNPPTCSKVDGSTVLSPTILYGPVAAGSVLSLEVPAGTGRKISLIAFAADTVGDCSSRSGSSPDRINLSAPHIVGSVDVDLAPGANEIKMTATMSGAVGFDTCSQWSATSVVPTPTASPSPTPTATPPISVSFNSSSMAMSESAGTVTLSMSLTSTSASTISIPYTVSGSASVADHSIGDGTLVIPPGSLSADITIVLNNDTSAESDETILFTAYTPTNADPGTFMSHTLTIIDDEVSVATSYALIGASTVTSGATSPLTIYVKNTDGSLITTASGHTLSFAFANGTSAGTLSAATNNGNGTYSSTFTGTTAGTASDIVVSIDAVALTSTAPIVTVVPGTFSLSASTLTLAANSITFGQSTTATVIAKDAAGNSLTTGGLTSLALGTLGGSSGVSLGAFTDNGNGTYSANITGTTVGGPTTIGATYFGTPLAATALLTVDVIPLTVSPSYPINAPNWNDYIRYDNSSGSYPWDQADVACTGTEQGQYGRLNGCVHGGQMKKVPVAGMGSCANLTASDTLGAFDWMCLVAGGTATFYSRELNPDKGLRDLVSASTWYSNSLTVQYSAQTIATSPSVAWWSNPVTSILTGGTITNLGTTGAVYTAAANTPSYGYKIGAPKVSVVTLAGVYLSTNAAVANTRINAVTSFIRPPH